MWVYANCCTNAVDLYTDYVQNEAVPYSCVLDTHGYGKHMKMVATFPTGRGIMLFSQAGNREGNTVTQPRVACERGGSAEHAG